MEIRAQVNGETFSFDTNDASDAVMRYLLEYGFKQSLADVGASETVAEHGGNEASAIRARREAARRRFDGFVKGEAPSGGGSTDKLASALVMVLKGAKVRRLAATPYTPQDVDEAMRGQTVRRDAARAFAEVHFSEANFMRIDVAADAIVKAKELA